MEKYGEIKMSEETPKRGEAGEDGHVIKIGTVGLSAAIPLPEELLEKMGWNTGDEIDISTTENCFDWGEVQSIVLRNITKEKSE